MFRLTRAEAEALNRSQFVTGSQKHRDPRFTPFAFTEHGAIMAATTLNSPRAVEMSIYVVRAFVKLRELLASNKELARRLDEIEARFLRQFGTYDQAIAGILDTLLQRGNETLSVGSCISGASSTGCWRQLYAVRPMPLACCPASALGELRSDPAVGFAERNTFLHHKRVRFFGRVYCGVEVDAVRAEFHRVDRGRQDVQRLRAEIDAAEQGQLQELQVALIA